MNNKPTQSNRAMLSFFVGLATRLMLLYLACLLLSVLLGKITPTSLIAFNLGNPVPNPGNPSQRLYVMDIGHPLMTRFGRDSAFNSYPAWSPDGNRLAYITDEGVSIFDFNSSQTRRLTDYGTVRFISWSSDGRQIAMESFMGKRADGREDSGITILNLSDGETHRFETDEYSYPYWIPNQQNLVFVHAYFDEVGRLFQDFLIINDQAELVRRFPQDDLFTDLQLDTSPDGQFITLSAVPILPGLVSAGTYYIYTIRLDDEQPHELTHYVQDEIGDRNPVWSPDGQYIAYWSSGEIFVVSPDGGDPLQITRNYGSTEDANPVWSPDGKQLLFAANDTGKRMIYLIDADGQNLRPIVSSVSGPFYLEAAWRP